MIGNSCEEWRLDRFYNDDDDDDNDGDNDDNNEDDEVCHAIMIIIMHALLSKDFFLSYIYIYEQ